MDVWVDRYMRQRTVWFLIGDVALLLLSLAAAAGLRFDGRVPPEILAQLPVVMALSLAIKVPIFFHHGLYRLSWSRVSLDDVLTIIRAVTIGTVAFWAIVFLMKESLLVGFPRGILLIDYVLTMYTIGGLRMSSRIYRHLHSALRVPGRRALLIGAGAAGEQLVRALRETPGMTYTPVGFIDDDPVKIGTVLHGLPILGNREQIMRIARERGVEAVLISMPSAPSRVIRRVVALAREAGVKDIRIIPGLDRIVNGQLTFSDLREIHPVDLLGRETVQIDTGDVDRYVRGRRVLVTGAGGSIGSELCRQIVQFGPELVVLLDRDETGLFFIEQEMQRLGQQSAGVVADICDERRVREVCQAHHPQIVFHAAAYKHVGLMERHPADAVMTNAFGTRAVATACLDAGVGQFVLISTDKAVNPTSMMGVSKRIAEMICLALNGRGPTRFAAVRFGNVLGSRGSVIPVFFENIRKGEPIIIRGENMRRYFMAMSEAVLLVLQAGAMSRGGEIFVLDMGEPVRILDLARDLIRLSGLEPERDVPIIVTDPDPGEKEHEDLLTAEEGTVMTQHELVFVARGSSMDLESLSPKLAELEEAVRQGDNPLVVRLLQDIVPTYRPSQLVQVQGRGSLSVTGRDESYRPANRAI